MTYAALGADVVVGDLTRPGDVAKALDGVQRMFFSMSVSPALLEATTTVATVARAVGHLDALVNISQLTVSQMDALSSSESPISDCISCRSRCSTGLVFRLFRSAPPSSWTPGCSHIWLRSPSPRAAPSGSRSAPAARRRSCPTTLRASRHRPRRPRAYLGGLLELTGPRSQDMNGVAEEYARALGKPVSYVDVPWDTWAEQTLPYANLGPYVEAHLAVMARLHRARTATTALTHTVEKITGRPAESVEHFVARRSDLFADDGARSGR